MLCLIRAQLQATEKYLPKWQTIPLSLSYVFLSHPKKPKGRFNRKISLAALHKSSLIWVLRDSSITVSRLWSGSHTHVSLTSAIWRLVCLSVRDRVHAHAKMPDHHCISLQGSTSRSQADIKGLHLQLSLLGCATEVITAGQGSVLWPKTETQLTDIHFKGKWSSDRLLF